MTNTLRPADPHDADVLAPLWHRGWREGHLDHVPDALLGYRRPEDFRRRAPGLIPHTTVATDGARIVGFVTVRDDEVDQLYVDAPARGTGAADALLALAERTIGSAHPRAWLAVVAGNTRARRFYERAGWRDAGPLAHRAPTADGGIVIVPSRRYEKAVDLATLTPSRAART